MSDNSGVTKIALSICKCETCHKIYSHRHKVNFPNDWQDLWENLRCIACLETDNDVIKCKKCGIYDTHDQGFSCQGCHTFFCGAESVCENPRDPQDPIVKYCEDCYPDFDYRPRCVDCDRTKDDLNSEYLYDCDICEFTQCNTCSPSHTRISRQRYRDIHERYCDTCNILSDSPEDIARRRSELVTALQEYRLELRPDSQLCQGYIDDTLSGWTLPKIVQKMCEMRYLYDYCDFKTYLSRAYEEQQEELDQGYYPDMSVSELAEDYAWRDQPCPNIFPWMKDSIESEIKA